MKHFVRSYHFVAHVTYKGVYSKRCSALRAATNNEVTTFGVHRITSNIKIEYLKDSM